MDSADFEVANLPFKQPYAGDTVTLTALHIATKAYASLGIALTTLAEEYAIPTAIKVLLANTIRSVGRHLENAPKRGMVEPPIIPLIRDEDIRAWKDEFSSRLNAHPNHADKYTMILMALAAFCCETSPLWAVDSDLHDGNVSVLPVDFILELDGYKFWKTISENSAFGKELIALDKASRSGLKIDGVSVRDSLVNLRPQAEELTRTVEQTRHDVEQLVAKLTSQSTRLDDTVEEISDRSLTQQSVLGTQEQTIEEIQKRIEEHASELASAEKRMGAFAKAVREELKIDTTRNLWKDRAQSNTTAFWRSAKLIGTAILLPVFLAVIFPSAVVGFFQHLSNAALPIDLDKASPAQLAAATISRLVIISAPLAMYIWAVKLLVRFNTRCMVLMDDATQRQTTMDTYFHLIENSGATPEERGLMLNAIFRPLPGQGNENVEPPNFVDIISKKGD
jgi:hypothetical protein